MKTYLPKIAMLQEAQGLWCVEAAWMDRISEAYYLGGDFDGRRDCCFYYMVWPDSDMRIWNVGLNLYGQLEVPFSNTRCVVLGTYRTLREAFAAAEDHAVKRLTTGKRASGDRSSVIADDELLPAQVTGRTETDSRQHLYS
jgi:hypothetical protein